MTRSAGRPGVVTAATALLATIACVGLAGVDPLSTLAGIGGLVGVVVGLGRRTRPAVTLGCGCLGAAVVLGAVAGAGGPATVAATGTVLFAWTAGQTSCELADHGRTARTMRLELTHVAGTALLVGGAAGVALLPRLLRVTPSPVGLALVLLGAVCLTGGLLTR